jgi:hypothetical protein
MTLRCLGVPVDATSHMFGDNGSVVTSSMMPDSQLNLRHFALSYHCVREAVASGMVKFHHIPCEINPSEVLSKHWGRAELWPRIKALLFWQGNTVDLFWHGDTTCGERGAIKFRPSGSPVNVVVPNDRGWIKKICVLCRSRDAKFLWE